MITGVVVAFYRIKRQNSKSQSEGSPQNEPGTDNVGFYFDEEEENGTQYDPVGVDQQKASVEFYCDGSPLNVQPVANSELEYFEIGSISSGSLSDVASVQLSWHATKLIKATPKLSWGDVRVPLPGLKKEWLCEDAAKRHVQSQCGARVDAEKSQLQSEFLGPAQPLSFEEIHKLNAPLGLPGHAEHSADPPSNRDALTSIKNSEKSKQDELSSLSVFMEIQTAALFSEHSFLSGQEDAATKEHCWDSILNTHLPFKSYLPVFEEIARLPSTTSPSCEVQNDIEEIT